MGVRLKNLFKVFAEWKEIIAVAVGFETYLPSRFATNR